MPGTARSRIAPRTYAQRLAGIHTVARRRQVVRPVGQALMLVTGDNCGTEVFAAYDETRAPGSFGTTLSAFGLDAETMQGKPPPGFSGASSLAFEEEFFTFAEPAVISQIPFEVEVGKTTEVLLIGHNFSESPVDTFTLILANGEPNLRASLGTVEFVPDPTVEGLLDLPPDSTVVKVDVTVDADHPTGTAFFAGVTAFLNYRVVRS